MAVELTCTYVVDIRIQSCLEDFTTLNNVPYHNVRGIQ